MTLPVQPPNFEQPPMQYDMQYLQRLIMELNQLVQRLNNPGELRGSKLTLTDLPTAEHGLPVGTVYIDNEGVLKVLTGHLPLELDAAAMSLGTVTTSP